MFAFKCYPLALITFSLTFLTKVSSHIVVEDGLDNQYQYKIVWKGPLPEDAEFNEEDVVTITRRQGRYKCIVPESDEELRWKRASRNSSEPIKTPLQLLEPLLSSNYCSYSSENFWYYELCHNKYLRQYHEKRESKFKSVVTQEFILGKVSQETRASMKKETTNVVASMANASAGRQDYPSILVNGQRRPYVMVNMTGGTKCDLIDKQRSSRIMYVCDEGNKIELHSVKEVSTCEYEAIVLTPLLCHHPDFKVFGKHRDITCYSLDGAPDKPINEEDAQEEVKEEKDRAYKRRGIAYFQGKTYVIDADFIDQEIF